MFQKHLDDVCICAGTSLELHVSWYIWVVSGSYAYVPWYWFCIGINFALVLSSSGLKVPPVAAGETSAVAGTDVLDMPVDPNEPTYCLCHQVNPCNSCGM